MKDLPETVKPYKKTKIFNEDSIPAGILGEHRTMKGVWGKINIIEGELDYIAMRKIAVQRSAKTGMTDNRKEEKGLPGTANARVMPFRERMDGGRKSHCYAHGWIPHSIS